MGHIFLVLIDAHSKWIEVYPVRAATSSATIQQLRIMFAQFWILETVVLDNGQCFVSVEFEEFLSCNGQSLLPIIQLVKDSRKELCRFSNEE